MRNSKRKTENAIMTKNKNDNEVKLQKAQIKPETANLADF